MGIVSTYFILFLLTSIGAFGGYYLKKAASDTETIAGVLIKPWIYVGGVLYLISALLNIYVLQYLPYTVVLPMTSITYIWTMLISFHFLKEKITFKKQIGVSLILLGAIFIGLFSNQ